MTSVARRATSSVSSSGGRRSSRPRGIAISPSSTQVHRRLAAARPGARARRRSHTATTDSTTASAVPTGRSPPSSTGSCARSATRWPTSACSSSVGPRPTTAGPRAPTRRRSFPGFPTRAEVVEQYARAHAARRLQPLLLLRVPVLAARVHLRGCLRAVRRGRDGRARRRERRAPLAGHASPRRARRSRARQRLTTRSSWRRAPAEPAPLRTERERPHHVHHERTVLLDPHASPLAVGELADALTVEREHAGASPLDAPRRDASGRRRTDRHLGERAGSDRHRHQSLLAARTEHDRDRAAGRRGCSTPASPHIPSAAGFTRATTALASRSGSNRSIDPTRPPSSSTASTTARSLPSPSISRCTTGGRRRDLGDARRARRREARPRCRRASARSSAGTRCSYRSRSGSPAPTANRARPRGSCRRLPGR